MKPKFWMVRSLYLFLAVFLAGCSTIIQRDIPSTRVPLSEIKVQYVQITEPVSQPRAEISGMAWYGDEWLIMLPQYPGFFTNDNDHGHIFALKKQDILDYLDGKRAAPIAPKVIAFVAPGLAQGISGFEGYEAIDFRANDAYLTIEAKSGGQATGYLVHALMADDMSSLTIDTTTPTVIDAQSELRNMSDESLFIADNSLVTLYEINGDNINPQPIAHRFGFDLQPLPSIPFANVDYRITDATSLDSNGRFWAINYFAPIEGFLERENEALMMQYGIGATQRVRDHVERLIEFQYSDTGITRIDQAPLYLQLSAIQHNWEGIVRLDDRGFLLATDKYPGTVLGFVEHVE